jgi:hypothetical protein
LEDHSEDWKAKAKCLGLDPNLFVPSGPGGSLKRVYVICNGGRGEEPCPVRIECSHFAVENGLVGVFGGQMHSQRTSVHVIREIQDGRPRPVVTEWPGSGPESPGDRRNGRNGIPGRPKSA